MLSAVDFAVLAAVPIALAHALAIIAVTVTAFHLDLAVGAAVARTLAHAAVTFTDGAVLSAVDLAVLAAVPSALTGAFTIVAMTMDAFHLGFAVVAAIVPLFIQMSKS